MAARALDDEIGRWLAGAADLGADAGVAGLQGAIGERGPVLAHLGVEGVAARRVDQVVVGARHPLHVGAELGLAAQVQRQMHAQAAGLGHGVDQPAEGGAAGQGEVVALGEERPGHVARVQPLRARGQRGRLQAGGVDHGAGEQLGALLADYQLNSWLRPPFLGCKAFDL